MFGRESIFRIVWHQSGSGSLKAEVEEKTFNFGSDIFVSDHSIMITADKKVLAYGGVIPGQQKQTQNLQAICLFLNMTVCRFKKIKLSADFVNAGANFLLRSDSSILPPGGLSKRISVFH